MEEAHRTFCEELEDKAISDVSSSVADTSSMHTGDASSQNQALCEGILGRFMPFVTAFGHRPLVYADWTASGRAHRDIEDYITHEVNR